MKKDRIVVIKFFNLGDEIAVIESTIQSELDDHDLAKLLVVSEITLNADCFHQGLRVHISLLQND